MFQPNSVIYFVDAYTPNEGEPELSLEYGVLRWNREQSDRPEVYVHTYLRPETSIHRVRWPNAQSYMKIDRDFIEGNLNLPTLNDMIEEDYLNGKNVVCFDASVEPFYNLTGNSLNIQSILYMWNTLYSDDENALKCTTIDEMCEYIGMLPDDKANTNYTPLLKRLTKMACLWSLLSEVERNPKCRRSLNSGGIQFNLVWPLPASSENWFDNDPKSLSELSDQEITNFFNSNLADRIDWFKMSMYAADWLYNRKKRSGSDDLKGKKELVEFVFNKVLSFKMQMWVLIFYSLYYHQKEVALEIALAHGDLRQLSPVALESFTDFVIDNLDVFLDAQQKHHLLSSLVTQSLEKNSEAQFQHYDYVNLKKKAQGFDGPQYFFYDCSYKDGAPVVYRQITNGSGKTVYRYYLIKAKGKDRALNCEFIIKKLKEFYIEAQDVFCPIWLDHDIKLWLQFIIGFDYATLATTGTHNDPRDLVEARLALKKIIEKCAYKYMVGLFETLQSVIKDIQLNDVSKSPICFSFQGISIEVCLQANKQNFLQRLISFQ
ncbi:MAG: hypothetical protein ACI4M7_05165 [Succinivibrio sp.]|mgnify:FL=1|nr:hypothetical protein [Succinivibrio sp.]HAO92197.1 hypothetical protein [Succinivibrio sp.]